MGPARTSSNLGRWGRRSVFVQRGWWHGGEYSGQTARANSLSKGGMFWARPGAWREHWPPAGLMGDSEGLRF